MRCGGRFGKAILRDGLGQRHLTEGSRPDRTRRDRMRPPASGEAGGKQPEADERHRDQHHAPRSTRLRDPLRGSRCSSRRAEPLRTWCRLGRRSVTERVRWSRLRGGPLARDGASRAPHGRLRTPTHDGHATVSLVRRRALRGRDRRGDRPLHGADSLGCFADPLLACLGATRGGLACAGGGAGCGAGAGAGGWETGGRAGGSRGGRSVSGSRYPFGSAVSRMPRYTYGSVPSTSPVGPIVPTTSPSATCVPVVTAIDPRWTSVTE